MARPVRIPGVGDLLGDLFGIHRLHCRIPVGDSTGPKELAGTGVIGVEDAEGKEISRAPANGKIIGIDFRQSLHVL